jgi:hypothetical protein
VPGRSHYAYPDFHPDDKWASEVLLNLARKMAVHAEIDPDTEKFGSESFVCLGSPVSNAMSRALLEYEYIDKEKPECGLRRSDTPIFRLPFEFELDKAEIKRLGRQH